MTQPDSKSSFVEIDLAAIRHNAAMLKAMVAPDVDQLAVVKADAYGHGLVAVARALKERVAWFGVNDIEEGITLRENGVETPILVFGVPEADTAGAYVRHGITATVSSFEHFDVLPEDTEYHINFDSGMGRLGFLPGQIKKVKKAINKYGGLTCTGIYSHFATANDPGSQKAAEQVEQFKAIRSEFEESLVAHMGNTGGTAFYPDAHFDMVRNGIGIYGYAPGATLIDGLKPALRWESRLVQVKPIEKGQSVSYGARWWSREDGYIAVIPVGYEEGIPRTLSGYLEVAINGTQYPVVGTVTMNYVMIYLKNNPMEFAPGQKVEVLGEAALQADTWANRADTIPYEILTGISTRIERRYFGAD